MDQKPELRSRLGRSPDRFDAVMMALGSDPDDAGCIGGDPDVTF